MNHAHTVVLTMGLYLGMVVLAQLKKQRDRGRGPAALPKWTTLNDERNEIGIGTMSEEMALKPGYTQEDVDALMETLSGMVELEEGELYAYRKKSLHHIQRRPDNGGLRRIKVMEEAYDAAQIIARRLRRKMRGYRPDPALVISACVMHVASLDAEEADAIALAYVQRLFQPESADESDSKSDPHPR